MNNWKSIWEKRRIQIDFDLSTNNYFKIFAELKRINGFDVLNGGIPIEALVEQYKQTVEMMQLEPGESVFEVGCGCGANLYMFYKDGFEIGGIDYSQALIDIMKKFFPSNVLQSCYCGEALDIEGFRKYDGVLANAVFHYFPSEKYAVSVLQKMIDMAKKKYRYT